MAKRAPKGNVPYINRRRRRLLQVTSHPDVSASEKADEHGRKRRWLEDGVLGAVCALVIGVYAYTAHEGAYTQPVLDAASSYYNLFCLLYTSDAADEEDSVDL